MILLFILVNILCPESGGIIKEDDHILYPAAEAGDTAGEFITGGNVLYACFCTYGRFGIQLAVAILRVQLIQRRGAVGRGEIGKQLYFLMDQPGRVQVINDMIVISGVKVDAAAGFHVDVLFAVPVESGIKSQLLLAEAVAGVGGGG